MALATIQNVRFAGMASCVPKRIVSNLTDCKPQLRGERERLVRNIGIETRRMAQEWQCFSDLAYDAACELLESLEWDKSEIDALIVVTQSPDYPIPATAIILQERLGLPTSALAFDINLGCSGYPFGLHVLASMISAGGVKKGLLLVGDRAASFNDPIFSDAGTATALEFCRDATPMYFDLNSDGSGYQAIILPSGAHRDPFNARHLIPTRDSEDEHWRYPGELQLDGPAVLSFSTQVVPPAVVKILDYSGLEKENIDYYIFHQANRLINETIRKKLKLDTKKVPTTLHDFGNTSGASLPITMTARINKELELKSNKVLLCGFGVGLSWGACVLDIKDAKFPDLVVS